MTKIPNDYLGADLFWWQDRPDLHTLITIHWGYGIEKENVHLDCILIDQNGEVQLKWQQNFNQNSFVVIDSKKISKTYKAHQLEEGILAVFVTTQNAPSKMLRENYVRLYSIIDWYSEEGELCTLHNDQSLGGKDTKIEFTEIILRETSSEKNYLVILNGPKEQKAGCIKLEIRNHRDEICICAYESGMKPFTIHKLYLTQLFPEIIDFCSGEYATLTGEFDATGLFTRPYIMTEGHCLSAYHGGNRYKWSGLPAVMYKFLGEGETNPVMAIHRDDITTTVNLLNSHGDLEDDFWVNARLYDEQGKMVAKQERWLLARRNGLSRGNIKDLLPDPTSTFTGHIVLTFSDDNKPEYPRRLQTLIEYRTSVNTSRVMVWSDCWNSPQRIVEKKKKNILYRGYFRVWYHPSIRSFISITNSGIGEDYRQEAFCIIKLVNHSGKEQVYEGRIPPQGSLFQPLNSLFPDVATFLGSPPVGLVLVESQNDLAKVQITHHEKSGVYSAEHFLPDSTYYDNTRYLPAGA